MNYFSEFHPIVNFLYFMAVMLFSMFLLHPVFIVISFVTGFLYLCTFGGVRTALKSVRFPFVIAVIAAVLNPVFNHRGMTILFYNRIGNPITKESILFGIFMGVMLMAVMVWFMCYNRVMTSDKFIYLFGRILPRFSLVISMTLRYIPRFKEQFGKIRRSRKAIGKDISDGNLLSRLRNMASIFSIMISWSLENSVETADSMKARGYGLKGRTAFHIYRFSKRDIGPLCVVIVASATLIFGFVREKLSYSYYPLFNTELFETDMIAYYMVFAILCLIPVILNQIYAKKYKAGK